MNYETYLALYYVMVCVCVCARAHVCILCEVLIGGDGRRTTGMYENKIRFREIF